MEVMAAKHNKELTKMGLPKSAHFMEVPTRGGLTVILKSPVSFIHLE